MNSVKSVLLNLGICKCTTTLYVQNISVTLNSSLLSSCTFSAFIFAVAVFTVAAAAAAAAAATAAVAELWRPDGIVPFLIIILLALLLWISAVILALSWGLQGNLFKVLRFQFSFIYSSIFLVVLFCDFFWNIFWILKHKIYYQGKFISILGKCTQRNITRYSLKKNSENKVVPFPRTISKIVLFAVVQPSWTANPVAFERRMKVLTQSPIYGIDAPHSWKTGCYYNIASRATQSNSVYVSVLQISTVLADGVSKSLRQKFLFSRERPLLAWGEYYISRQ